MITKKIYSIFKQGSRTYFYSSLFFPAKVKDDVFTLYSFVRTADDYVDQVPAQVKSFRRFRKEYEAALSGKPCQNEIIQAYVSLAIRKNFDPQWTEAFLDAMESDLNTHTYRTLEKTISYMHGSAEVIGLMMAKIMDLPPSAYQYAKKLGRAMQYVNFIRDIAEDLELGRNYFPQTEMKKYGLASLSYQHTSHNQPNYKRFMAAQLQRYNAWQEMAATGFKLIPRRYLIPIKTASDLYNWSASQIAKDPMIVYQKKMKP
ncbi:MAG: 15-cis-phytoene synthase, partial [Patescibacteria group bacterium]|nr:15-cis-phytoene synthase [Patescibacteria group bacterium]